LGRLVVDELAPVEEARRFACDVDPDRVRRDPVDLAEDLLADAERGPLARRRSSRRSSL
jgi:hypothetical protein